MRYRVAFRNGCILLAAVTAAAGAKAATISLGAAGNYAVLAGAEAYNTGGSVINGGNVGAPAVVGFSSATIAAPYTVQTSGLSGALADFETALSNAETLTPTQTISSNLNGMTFTPGVYKITSSSESGTVTLNDEGQTDPLFVFQFASSLTTVTDFDVVTENTGAGSVVGSNVFWTAGSLATLGSSNQFEGHILSGSEITLGAHTTIINGSALAGSLVNLDDNTIDNAVLSPAVAAPTPAPIAGGAALLVLLAAGVGLRRLVAI